jgi:hypothetical protein
MATALLQIPDANHRDFEHHARERWWREEELIKQRLGWLLSAQAVVGGGYGWLRHRMAETTVDVARAPDLPMLQASLASYATTLRQLSKSLWWIGIVAAGFVLLGVSAAIVAQYAVQAHYRPYGVHLGVSRFTTMAGHVTAVALPALCIVGWQYLDQLLQ